MSTLQKRPYGRACLALFAFMVVVALLETLFYVVLDFSTFWLSDMAVALPETKFIFLQYMLFFIKSAGLAFVLGLFVAVRVLRIRPSLLFTLFQASLLWLLVLVVRAMLVSIYIAKTYNAPLSDGVLPSHIGATLLAINTMSGAILSFVIWLMAVALCWALMRFSKII